MTALSLPRAIVGAVCLSAFSFACFPARAADPLAVTFQQVTHNTEREFVKQPRWVSADPAHPGLLWRYGKAVSEKNPVPPPVFPYLGVGFGSEWVTSLVTVPLRDTETAGDIGVLPVVGSKTGLLVKQVLADAHPHKDETGAVIRDATVLHSLKVGLPSPGQPSLEIGPASRPIAFTIEKGSTETESTDVLESKTIADDGGDLWLAGVTPSGPNIHVFHAPGGQKWAQVKSLGHGDDPSVFACPHHEIGVLYNDASEPLFDGKTTYLPAGHLRLTRTADNGKTWTKPEALLADQLVALSHTSVSPNGRLYAVYETVDPKDWAERSTLWLISSADAGRTWSAPQRVTDGSTLDSEPQALAFDDHVLVAFTRKTAAIADVWVASVALK